MATVILTCPPVFKPRCLSLALLEGLVVLVEDGSPTRQLIHSFVRGQARAPDIPLAPLIHLQTLAFIGRRHDLFINHDPVVCKTSMLARPSSFSKNALPSASRDHPPTQPHPPAARPLYTRAKIIDCNKPSVMPAIFVPLSP